MLHFASALAALPMFLIGAVSDAQSPNCPCPGRSLHQSSGGDASPLNWRFQASEKSRGNPQQHRVLCYVRHVENASQTEVRDVLWKVAGYVRDVIPARTARPSCVDFPGEMSATPVLGPLHFGVSSQHYDTTVRPPQSGWMEKSAQATADLILAPPLRSEFILDTRAKDGQLQASHVMIESSANYDGKVGKINFALANEGAGGVRVFLNIPAVPKTYEDVPAAKMGGYYLKSGDRVTFTTFVSGKPEFRPTTIIFYGEDGKLAAQETAGLYVPAEGKVPLSDEKLWDQLR